MGVLARPGHTEATVDLARMAGLKPAGLCCEIMDAGGAMSDKKSLFKLAKEKGLKIGSIQDLIEYRKIHENLLNGSRKQICLPGTVSFVYMAM